MKREKGSALPVFLLLLVVAFIGGVSYYKFMVYDKKDNSKPKENNTVVDNGSTNNNENNDNKTYDKIAYEIKDNNDEWNRKVLYVNGKKVDKIVGEDLEVNQYMDFLIVEEINPGGSLIIYGVNNSGDLIEFDYKNDYNDKINNSGAKYEFKDNYIYIDVNRQLGNAYTDWYCRISNTDSISKYRVGYKYLGNGAFDKKKIISETKAIDSEEYKKDCNDVKIFADMIKKQVCTRSNNEIKCYDSSTTEKAKESLIKIFGQESCDIDSNNSYVCESADYLCDIANYATNDNVVTCNSVN